MSSLSRFAEAIARHTPQDGTFACALPGVKLIRASAPSLPMPVIYEPTVCFVAQGRKQALVGTTTYHYDSAQHLIASVGLPVMGSVIEASSEAPYLCLQLDLDMAELSDLALRHPPASTITNRAPTGLMLNATPPALIDAVARLVALLDTPEDIVAMAPLTIREILYRLISSPGGDVVRLMARADSRLNQIARAIIWIRTHFTEPCKIEQAAELVGMSRSTFHLHFKAITGLSPLEYRTQLRLMESRRLMVSEAMDAASAGFAVGYESPSQFSRKYARLFGAPPAKDAKRLRRVGAASA